MCERRWRTSALASASDRKTLGYLTEAYASRRYLQELEWRRSAQLGERDLFSIGPAPQPMSIANITFDAGTTCLLFGIVLCLRYYATISNLITARA
jgi:hypothetical protein